MITISQDAEFMSNLVSANPIPPGNRFFAFSDENLNPAVLSHSQDNKLNLVLEVDGTAQLYDVGNICGLSGDLQAFAAFQDSDLNVWIAAGTDAGNNTSNFYFIINLKPTMLLNPPTENIIRASSAFPQIHGVYMSNFTRAVGSLGFPLSFIAFQPLDRITKEDQLGYIDVSLDSTGNTNLTYDTSWSLATNTLKILDVTFGTCRVGKGAFVLYETSGNDGKDTELKLQFRVFEGHNFSVELNAPSGATCLNAYHDSLGKSTSFLVGGDNIIQYKYDDYKIPTGTGTTVVGDSSSTLGITAIHNAQNSDNITVWYTTSADEAWYYSATTSDMTNGLLVQLLSEGRGGQVSGLLSLKTDNDDSSTLINTLLSVDEEGQLRILQQASDTAMWASHSFYIPSATNNINMPTYTLRIKAHTDSSDPSEKVENSQLYLSTSALVRVKCNGRTTTLDQKGAWVQTDHSGTATVLITVADMSCPTVQVEKFSAQGHDEVVLSDIPVLVPTSKVFNKLKSIQTGDDLLNAKTQSGENLIDSGTVSQDDANNAASIIQELTKEHSLLTRQTTQARLRVKSSAVKTGRTVHIAGTPSEAMIRASASADPLGSSPWDFFLFLYQKAKEAVSWVMQRVDDVLHFIITLAGEVYTFICDTVEAIGKALSWVFAKIEAAIEKLIDFIGFLFKWGDILTFSDSIVTYLNVSLDYGESQLDTLREKADAYIDDITAMIKNWIQVPVDRPSVPDNALDSTNSVSHNWVGYQLSHGGFQKNTALVSTNLTSSDDQDTLEGLWNDVKKELSAIADGMEEVGQALCSMVDGNLDEFFSMLANGLIDIISNSLKLVVDILLKGVGIILSAIKDIGNRPANIPIFTALWKWITNGRDLTVFNFIGLIVAIPTTIIYKLISNSTLPALAGRLTTDTFSRYLSGDTTLDADLIRDLQVARVVTPIVSSFVLFDVILLTFAVDAVTSDASLSKLPTSANAWQVKPGIATPPAVGNVVDVATLVLTGVGLFFTWPTTYSRDVSLHSWVWGLDLSNGIILAISRCVGYSMGIPRVETKRAVGVWEQFTAIPIFILELIIAHHEFQLADGDPDKNDGATTCGVFSDTFQLTSCAGFCTAAVTEQIQDEIFALGFAVFGLSFFNTYLFKLVSIILKYKAKM